MKSPAALVRELKDIVFEIEDDILAVRDYGELLAFVTASTWHESCHRGMNRLAMLINAQGETIDKAHDRMTAILQHLANP